MIRTARNRGEVLGFGSLSCADLAWDALFQALTRRGFDPTGCRAFLDSSASDRIRRDVEFRKIEPWDAAAQLTRSEVESTVREESRR